MTKIAAPRIHDLRFPTSQSHDGSDAMNPDQDYSAAYFLLETDGVREGYGPTSRFGRGNEIRVATIYALCDRLVGVGFDWIKEGIRRFWLHVTSNSQLHWIGPDNGAYLPAKL